MGWAKPRGDRFLACWRDAAGRERSRGGFLKKREAERYANRQEQLIADGIYIDPDAGKQTLEVFFQTWYVDAISRARNGGRPSLVTLEKYEGIWRLYVAPVLGECELRGITRASVQDMVDQIQTHSRYQAREALALTRMLLGRAVKDERLLRNVAALVDTPHIEPGRPFIVEPEVIERIARAVPARFHALILVLAYSSLRWSEAVALRVSSVDFLRRQIEVTEKIVELRRGFERREPKTRLSRRVVSVPAVVIEALAEHVRAFGTGPDGLIFAASRTTTATPVRRRTFYRDAWRPALASLGIPWFPLKQLRHTGASIAGELSGDPKLVQERLGHSSLAMVSRVYQGVFDRRHREIADAMDTVARRARDVIDSREPAERA